MQKTQVVIRNNSSRYKNSLISKTTPQYGCYDTETYTLSDGIQRLYYLLVYHVSIDFRHFRKCDYKTEEIYYQAIRDFFEANPGITWFSFNGKSFDHIILNKILNNSSNALGLFKDGKGIRRIKWKGSTFLDILYWLPPCSLRQLSKTWLNEDIKEIFPHDAVTEDMVLNRDSKFDTLSSKDFPDSNISSEDVARFSDKPFWPISESYITKDVQILVDALPKIEDMYNSIGYSITDPKFMGMAGIAFDHLLRFIKEGTFKSFTRELYDNWKSCYKGGVVDLFDLNLKQEMVYAYDINSLYPWIMLEQDYPVGECETLINVDPSKLPELFGLIKAHVYMNPSNPLSGIPIKVGKEFNRVKGRVFYEGTTEELKMFVNERDVIVEKIVECLHYKDRKSGRELFGKAIDVFNKMKDEGTREGNLGKRAFGKLGNNSSYGKFGLNWDTYNIYEDSRSNLAVGCFITAGSRMKVMKDEKITHDLGIKRYYSDTDSGFFNKRLPSYLVDQNKMGYWKYEGYYDVSVLLGRKQYYLENTETGEKKVGCKGYNKANLTRQDWIDARNGKMKVVRYLQFKKENYTKIRKVYLEKEFKKSLHGRVYREDGTS